MLDVRFLLVLGCFVLSGMAGLIYQTAWTQQFAFVFGTSELAVATVLAAYMAGLMGGAYLAGRFLRHLRRPLWIYGLLELGIAVFALAVPATIRLAHRAQVLWLGNDGMTTVDGSSAVFYLFAAFVILFPATALMGATLPILARYAVRTDQELGARIGSLYSANTAGAALGTLIASFFLLPSFGLGYTVWTAVGLNAGVFVLAVLLEKQSPAELPSPLTERSTVEDVSNDGRWILPLILVSGIVSFTWEVLWTRLLSHILGGSIYAFGIMLATFLVGIAAGSWLASRWADSRDRATVGFAIAQLGAAAGSLGAYLAADRLPSLLAGKASDNLRQASWASAATLLPGALFIGATFPFAVRILAGQAADAGPSSARVYAWNTFGAILGAVGSGFFLLPILQFEGTARAAVATSCLLACLAMVHMGRRPTVRRPKWLLAPALLGLLAMITVSLPTPWNILRTAPISGRAIEGDISFFSVGRSSTVLVSEQPGLWRLSTNGLPESAILAKGTRIGAFSVARWLSMLPTVSRPDLESMLIIGLGAGITLDGVPDSVDDVHVVELEPEVVEANRRLAHLRAKDSLSDPRVTLHINDARSVLHLSRRSFDAIVSQPSHPWTAGASHLFTREFFELVRSRLNDSGVFVQWIGLRFLDESLLRTLLATLTDVFPHVEVYQPPPGGALLFLAANQPLDVEQHVDRSFSRFRDAWTVLGHLNPASILACRRLDAEGSRRFAADAPVSSDFHNLFQTRSPKAMRNPLNRKKLEPLLTDLDPLIRGRAPDNPSTFTALRALIQQRHLPRAEALSRWMTAQAANDGASEVGEALLAAYRREQGRARQLLNRGRQRALQKNHEPVIEEIENASLLLDQQALLQGRAPGLERKIMDRRGDAALMLEALRHQSLGRPHSIRALEDRLAAISPSSSLFVAATRLRIYWRQVSGDPALAAEALRLLDPLLALDGQRSRALLQRIDVATVARDTGVLKASYDELLRNLQTKIQRAPSDRSAAQRLLNRLERTPEELRSAIGYTSLRHSFQEIVDENSANR